MAKDKGKEDPPKSCPHCGHRMNAYQWYCGDCGQ